MHVRSAIHSRLAKVENENDRKKKEKKTASSRREEEKKKKKKHTKRDYSSGCRKHKIAKLRKAMKNDDGGYGCGTGKRATSAKTVKEE